MTYKINENTNPSRAFGIFGLSHGSVEVALQILPRYGALRVGGRVNCRFWNRLLFGNCCRCLLRLQEALGPSSLPRGHQGNDSSHLRRHQDPLPRCWLPLPAPQVVPTSKLHPSTPQVYVPLKVEDYITRILKGKPENTSWPPIDGSETVDIIHVSDIHTDLLYKEGTKVRCSEPVCCRED